MSWRRVALAVLGAGLIVGCRGSQAPPVVAKTAADSAEQVLYGVRSLLTTNGVQRGELLADTGFVYDDQTRFDLRRVTAKFTTETGQPYGTMRADRGAYSLRTQVLEGWGNAVITLSDGRTLKSPHLVYNQATNLVSSDTSYDASGGDRTQHARARRAMDQRGTARGSARQSSPAGARNAEAA